MKVGDIVLFNENDTDYVATVLEVRELDDHYGQGGEPLLHLGFFKPLYLPNAKGEPTRVSVVGTHRQDQLAQIRIDVAHVSHEFDEKLKRQRYPGGRWREAAVSDPFPADGSGSERWGASDWTKAGDGTDYPSDRKDDDNTDDLQRTDPNTGLVDPNAPKPANTDQSGQTTNLNGTEGDSSIQSEK